jgi:hypothetical protein
MNTYKVKYYAGTYSGVKEVRADDEEEAIAIVRAWVRKHMTIPMYSDGYKIID